MTLICKKKKALKLKSHNFVILILVWSDEFASISFLFFLAKMYERNSKGMEFLSPVDGNGERSGGSGKWIL